MFDIGFWEISLIMVVALLVIGPERLPGVARKAGLLINKGRGFIRTVKADIEHEIAADELKKVLKDQAQSSGVHEIIEEATDNISKLKEAAKQDDLFSSSDEKADNKADTPNDSNSTSNALNHAHDKSLDKSKDT